MVACTETQYLSEEKTTAFLRYQQHAAGRIGADTVCLIKYLLCTFLKEVDGTLVKDESQQSKLLALKVACSDPEGDSATLPLRDIVDLDFYSHAFSSVTMKRLVMIKRHVLVKQSETGMCFYPV